MNESSFLKKFSNEEYNYCYQLYKESQKNKSNPIEQVYEQIIFIGKSVLRYNANEIKKFRDAISFCIKYYTQQNNMPKAFQLLKLIIEIDSNNIIDIEFDIIDKTQICLN